MSSFKFVKSLYLLFVGRPAIAHRSINVQSVAVFVFLALLSAPFSSLTNAADKAAASVRHADQPLQLHRLNSHPISKKGENIKLAQSLFDEIYKQSVKPRRARRQRGRQDDYENQRRRRGVWYRNRGDDDDDDPYRSRFRTSAFGLAPFDPENGDDRFFRRAPAYRTMCVRLCDGYYFPISYGTTRSRFRNDRNQCQSSCSAPTKLFVYNNQYQDVPDMVDLRGKPYTSLETAFKYRTERVKSCTCAPDPWSAEAKQKHVEYARLEKENKNKVATYKKRKRYKARRYRKNRDYVDYRKRRSWKKRRQWRKRRSDWAEYRDRENYRRPRYRRYYRRDR